MADSGDIAQGMAAEAPQGPASSIDSLHFIPVEALRTATDPVLEAVDVADLVLEVRRALGLVVPDPVAPVSAEPVTPMHVEPVAPVPAEPVTPMHVEPVAPLTAGPDNPLSDDSDGGETLLLEAEMEAEGYELREAETGATMELDTLELQPLPDEHTTLPAETIESAVVVDEDPLSDSEVFHRNRDQLYHPPAEPSRRKLMLTAVVLTFCVLVIIAYLLLDKSEPHAIPGRPAVGEQPAAASPWSRT